MPGLDWLRKMMDNVDEKLLAGSFDKVRPNEKVISDKRVDPETRKLFAVNLSLMEQANKKVVELMKLHTEVNHDDKKCSRLLDELHQISYKGRLVERLFWLTIRIEFNCHNIDTLIGIREDWKVVTYDDKTTERHEKQILGHICVHPPGSPEYGN